MTPKPASLDPSFLHQQRLKLIALREQIGSTIEAGVAEETGINGASQREAEEAEDDAQRLSLLEIDGTLIERHKERLIQIQRALQKLDEGTYGFADTDGAPIPRERLLASPEATEAVAAAPQG